MNDNYYNYLFKHVLKDDTLEIKTLTQYNHLYLCAYSINTNNSKPDNKSLPCGGDLLFLYG